MTAKPLEEATDDEIRIMVAEMCRWTEVRWSTGGMGKLIGKTPAGGVGWPVPDYLNDANAVLPLLEKTFAVFSYHADRSPPHLCADVDREGTRFAEGFGPFPRAACVALLRAHGVEVVES